MVLGAALGALSLGVAGEVVRPRRAEGCALVGRRRIPVRIDAEEALIVWDAAHHREHFVRQARFEGAGHEPFGFLVPTPTQPEVAEADEAVFVRLASIYGLREAPAPASTRRARGAHGASDAVEVVAVARVAGLDATVLRATDARALAAWLGGHGFSSRPGLTAWLRRYVDGGWFVTAFRYDGHGAAQFGSRAVRLSFGAERPFYPYAEPGDQPQQSDRTLRVTVVSNERVEGEVGGAAWGARTGYAGRPSLGAALLGAVPHGAAVDGAWMTTFEQPSSVRGASDLFFRRSADQGEVAPSIRAVRWEITRVTPAPQRAAPPLDFLE